MQRPRPRHRSSILKSFWKKYESLLSYVMDIRHGPLHNQVIASIEAYIDDGRDLGTSIRRAVKKHRRELEDEFEEAGEEDDDIEEEDGDEDED
jgi:hypothetical protein